MTDYKLVPVDLLSELAESLACELDARYPASVRSYESQDRKYQAEMEPVLTARQIIAAAPAVQGEPVGHDWDDQDKCRRCGDRDWYASATCTPKQQPAEQHPDDAAVDAFAAAMKAKLAKKREEGRHGWQNLSASALGALLYRHVYKADPLDVGNIAMMIHQNGQAIELPFEAQPDVTQLVEALESAKNLIANHSGEVLPDQYAGDQIEQIDADHAAHRKQQEGEA